MRFVIQSGAWSVGTTNLRHVSASFTTRLRLRFVCVDKDNANLGKEPQTISSEEKRRRDTTCFADGARACAPVAPQSHVPATEEGA